MSKQSESATCLGCGRARAAPAKDIFKDVQGTRRTFCNSACYMTYVKKQPKVKA